MLGITVVFCMIFFVLRSQTTMRFSDVLIQQGREISENNVSRIDQIFFESMRLGDLTVSRLEEEKPTREELPLFLKKMLGMVREECPEIMALVVAQEPGPDGSGADMRLARYGNGKITVLQGGDYLEKSWYVNQKAGRKGIWCEPFIGDFIKEPIAIYTLPYYRTGPNGQKQFAGVVCVDLSLAFLRKAVAGLPVKNAGYGFILSARGRIVAHPRPDWLFKESLLSLAARNNSSLRMFAQEIRTHKSGLFMGRISGGAEACMYYTPMKSNGWTFGIVFPSREFFATQKEFDFTFLVIGLCGFVIMILVVFWVSIRVSRPLKVLAGVAGEIGKGNFDVLIPPIRSRDEIGMFASAFNQMRISLAEHIENLKNVTAAKEKIESELKVAQEIQMGILPKILPPFPKCDYFEVDAFLTAAREVGGDLYDFFLLSPSKVCLVIGDVSGKGVPASLFMAVTQTLHRGLAHETGLDPQILVTKMNQALCNNNSANLFVTYVFAVLDLEKGVMTYCNAGHNPFFVLKCDGNVESPVKRHGIPLGVRPNRPYGKSDLNLNIGDTLFFYTDGVTEAKNSANEFFGEERLAAVLKRAAMEHLSPLELDQSIRDALAEFVGDAEQFDDITVVSLKILRYA